MAVELVRYWANGTIVYSSTGSVVATVPSTIADEDYLLRFIASKGSTAIPTVPVGWFDLGSFKSTTGIGSAADVGDIRITVHGKPGLAADIGTTQTITLAGNTAAWTVCYTMRKSATNAANAAWDWYVDAFFGQDTTGATDVSVTFGAIDIAATDMFMVAMAIPSDVTTPAEFTAEAITATGITFGTMTEIAEPDSTAGDDIGGVIFRHPVSSGSSGSVAPTVTATAAATNTNTYGPMALVRLREGLAATFTTTVGSATAAGGSSTFTGGAGFTSTTGGATGAGGSTTLTGAAAFTTVAAGGAADGGTSALTGAGLFATTTGPATADGGVTTFNGGSTAATFTTLVGTAAGDGGSSAFTGAATLTTVNADATAAGEAGSLTATATFTSLSGGATADGGSGAFAAGSAATFATTAAAASADGGVSAFTATATLTTLAGLADGSGGVSTFGGAALFLAVVAAAIADGGVGSMTVTTTAVTPASRRTTIPGPGSRTTVLLASSRTTVVPSAPRRTEVSP